MPTSGSPTLGFEIRSVGLALAATPRAIEVDADDIRNGVPTSGSLTGLFDPFVSVRFMINSNDRVLDAFSHISRLAHRDRRPRPRGSFSPPAIPIAAALNVKHAFALEH
jgi:hypothetical protein